MKLKLLLLLSIAVAHATAARASSELEDRPAKHLRVEMVQLVQGLTEDDLGLARYQDEGPVVAVVVGESPESLYVYLEPSDVGAALLRLGKAVPEVETLVAKHKVTCDDITAFLVQQNATGLNCRAE